MIIAEVVLFDLGNTLFYDNRGAWPRIYKKAELALWRSLRASGVRLGPAALYGSDHMLLTYYYSLRGEGLEEPGTFYVLKNLLALHGAGIQDEAVERALRAMYKVTQRNWRLEHDTKSTLRLLAREGFRLGAVSNGSDHRNALELLEKARLHGAFEQVITSAAHGRRKPDASIFQAALDHFGVSAGQVVMVGDNYEADVLGAHALGMASVWITRRVHPQPPAQPIVPDAIVKRLREIPALLKKPPPGQPGSL